MKPMVFSGLYPTDSGQYQALRDALEKLRLNDSSFTYEPETSQALGFGFRCGFLGLLHMDIVRERLEREFSLSLITTAATVVYRVITIDGRHPHDRQSGQAAQRIGDRADRRAGDPSDAPSAPGVSRRCAEDLRREARHAKRNSLSWAQAGHAGL